MVRRLIETNLQIQKTVEPLIKTANEIRERVAEATPMLDSLSDVLSHAAWPEDFMRNSQWLEELQRIQFPDLTHFINALQSTMEVVGLRFEALSPRVQEALLLIAKHGWYFNVFDHTFPLVFRIAEALEMGNVAAVDKFMVDYYEKRLDEIEKYLVSKYPNRGHLFESAFRAHSNEDYELSTLAFLTQVDGICWDTTAECSFFVRKGRQPETADFVEREIGRRNLTRAMLAILTHSHPIHYGRSERQSWEEKHGRSFSAFNRHRVLHGESVDYGTQENSLRAISLLYYVARAFEHGQQMKEKTS